MMFGALMILLQNLHRKKKLITVPHGNCYLLASEDGTTVNKTEITSLFSNQKEKTTQESF